MVLDGAALNEVKLLFVLFPLDHHDLLSILVLLPDALQSPEGFGEIVSAVPSVPVFGKAAHHVQALQDIHNVVNPSPFHICKERVSVC